MLPRCLLTEPERDACVLQTGGLVVGEGKFFRDFRHGPRGTQKAAKVRRAVPGSDTAGTFQL